MHFDRDLEEPALSPLERIALALEKLVSQQAEALVIAKATRDALDSAADAKHAIFDEIVSMAKHLNDVAQSSAEIAATLDKRG